MTHWANIELTGWGRIERVRSRAARPEKLQDVAVAIADARAESLIARGAGRSYGDAALNSSGRTLLTERLDRFLSFDPATGDLVSEPGATFGDVLRYFIPRGYMCPVVPGTGYATLGGGIANDVHGKNHHVVGSIGNHLRWLDLRLPDGTLRRVDANPGDPLFRATLGGVGLTGIIEKLCLRLMPVPSNAVAVTKRRVRNLAEFIELFADRRDPDHYVVGWIDALARGPALGRGILETANPAGADLPAADARRYTVPVDFPSIALNPLSVRLFNAIYYRVAGRTVEGRPMPYGRFLFPLDSVLRWNRIYGRRGFRQFQCVVPFTDGEQTLRRMLELVSRSGKGSFLAVIKVLGSEGMGYLSFPRPGLTLALDFPNGSGVEEVIHALEAMTVDRGGRVYLAKDSTLQRAHVGKMYPELEAYRSVVRSIDSKHLMRSDLSVRLALRD